MSIFALQNQTTMATVTQKIKVQVNNTSVMNSIENASITVKSPSGRTVILYKKHLGRKATEEMKDVFWKCANNPMEAFIGEVELTIEEMKVVLAMSKL